MQQTLRPYVTAGIALVGASLVATTPMATPPTNVQQRPVKLGALFGNLRSITDGLKPDERVIVNGMLSAMPGAKVNPHEVAISTESLDALESIAAGPRPAPAPPEMGASAQSDSQQSAGAGQ